jgi:hypothetical protein
MAGEFNTVFKYAGHPISQGFYDLISLCENAMECHKTLLELFMNALKANSVKYRTNTFTPVNGIANQTDLDAVLTYVPEDLKDPLVQVMFEEWNLRKDAATIGNNSWYIETYANATNSAPVPGDLQNAVNRVRSVYYALLYNELTGEYASKGWPGTAPVAIDNPTPQNDKLNPDFVKVDLGAMKTWLTNNNPQVVALNALKSEATAPDILGKVFGTAPVANVDAAEFCQVLLNQIQVSNAQKVAGPKGAVRLFLEAVEAQLTLDNIWYTTAELQKLTEQFRAKTVEDYWRRYTSIAFGLVGKLFRIGLTLAAPPDAAQAKASILAIFTKLNDDTVSKPAYLFDELTVTRESLVNIVCPDLAVLAAWAIEMVEAIPKTIYYSDIDGLLEVVTEQLSSIPLKTDAGGFPVRLFPFSLYDNIKVKKDVVHFPRESTSETSDVVNVAADASETNAASGAVTPYNRPVMGSFTRDYLSPQKDKLYLTFLKFFNVQDIRDGTFYFTDPVHPTLVQTNGFADPPVELSLFFDFKAVTINGLGATPEPVGPLFSGTHYALLTATGVSKKNFIIAIKALSKWKNLNGQRNYDVIYETVLDKTITINSHLIWYLSSGELNRTDELSDDLCLWEWSASDGFKAKYPKLPKILGLPLASEILASDYPIDYYYQKATSDSACFMFESIRSNLYVLTNTPQPNLPSNIDHALSREAKGTNSIADKSKEILDIFNFNYHRKIDPVKGKVIKYLPASHKPNSAAQGVELTQKGPDDEKAIGINPPISFRLLMNAGFFKNYTAADGISGVYLKNKGNPLYRAKGKRLQAGGVMSGLRNSITVTPKPGSNSSLSADELSIWELKKSKDVLARWQSLKQTDRGTLPTNQEWCHLLGHGDGGDERLGNFVSGSFHCNTEQLAMESKGRRGVTQTSPRGTFELRSTAYLFNDDQAFISGNYLKNDAAYQKMTIVQKKLKLKPIGFRTNGAGKVLPLASLIRYKMYQRVPSEKMDDGATPSTTNIKLFDHIFEGQSEFMDRHQFSILKHAAWFALAGMDAFKKWYKEQEKAFDDGLAAMDL